MKKFQPNYNNKFDNTKEQNEELRGESEMLLKVGEQFVPMVCVGFVEREQLVEVIVVSNEHESRRIFRVPYASDPLDLQHQRVKE